MKKEFNDHMWPKQSRQDYYGAWVARRRHRAPRRKAKQNNHPTPYPIVKTQADRDFGRRAADFLGMEYRPKVYRKGDKRPRLEERALGRLVRTQLR